MTFDLDKTTSSDLTNAVTDYTVPAMSTDGVSNQKETTWQNDKWTTQFGWFNQNADLKSAITMKAIWTVGKGWESDIRNTVLLEHIKGWGKDTFDDIMYNMQVTKRIGGDAYCEIMRNKEGSLINLKPLDPSTIRIVLKQQGIIIRYEQVAKLPNNKESIETFKPNQILHISNNRIADQIHGISDIDILEDVLKAEEESFRDIKKLMARQARPMLLFHLKTDDQATISAFIKKMDKATADGENIYIPDDSNTLKWEQINIAASPLLGEWRDDIRNKFYRTVGLPQVVGGAGGKSTESEAKVIFLAFEQIVEKDQRELEQQLWNQLGIKINFIHPSSVQEGMQQDQAKDANSLTPQPSDTQI